MNLIIFLVFRLTHAHGGGYSQMAPSSSALLLIDGDCRAFSLAKSHASDVNTMITNNPPCILITRLFPIYVQITNYVTV